MRFDRLYFNCLQYQPESLMNSKFILLVVLVIGLTLVAVWALPTSAAPQPSRVPQPGTWQLDFELHGNPKQIQITLPGDTQPRIFWYLLYTVTNNTSREVEFYPQFDLFTDNFLLYHAEDTARKPVFEAIRKLYRQSIPLLEPQEMVTGKILIGEDNARDSVAIFADFDPNANSAKIFVSGLSNETVTVANPVNQNSDTKKPEKILLRKTLMLQYQVPGDQYNPRNRAMLYRSRNWIMR